MDKKGMVVLPWIIALFIIAFLILVFYLPATLFISGKSNLFGISSKAGWQDDIASQEKDLTETNNLIAFLNTPVNTNSGIKKMSEMMKDDKYKDELSKQSVLLDSLSYKEPGCMDSCLFSYSIAVNKGDIHISSFRIESKYFLPGFCVMHSYSKKAVFCRIFAGLFLNPNELLKVELTKAREDFKTAVG